MAVVYLDLDGTLVHYDRSFGVIFDEACATVGVDARDEYRRYYTETFFERFAALDEDPFLTAARALSREFTLDIDPVEFRDARVGAELAATTVVTGVHDTLDALSSRYRLGILTNGLGAVQRAKLEKHDLLDAVETVVCSHDVGAVKPDVRIFEAATERLSADRYVYVGDSRDHDIVGALDAGWSRVVHVASECPKDTDDDPACPADAHLDPEEIARLTDIL